MIERIFNSVESLIFYFLGKCGSIFKKIFDGYLVERGQLSQSEQANVFFARLDLLKILPVVPAPLFGVFKSPALAFPDPPEIQPKLEQISLFLFRPVHILKIFADTYDNFYTDTGLNFQ